MSKREFTPEQNNLSHIAKALAHPVRIAILQLLASQECCYHGDMSKVIPVAKSTLSQHLRELKDAGLIRGTITPPSIKYCIDSQSWKMAKSLLGGFFKDIKDNNEMNNDEKKELVKQRYSELALDSSALKKSCACGSTTPLPAKRLFTIMSENYSTLRGYEADADLGVGCGLPTEFAELKRGDTVVDLGSGAGNDCFVARAEVGDLGRVVGVDFSPQMVEKARNNATKRGYTNVEFIEGDIEKMPLPDNTVDVVVSNCVLNLLPEKDKIFKEIYRILKPGGHFSVSDVVLEGHFPKNFTDNASMYAGCIASAIQKSDYIYEIERADFEKISIQKTKAVLIPDSVLEEHLDHETIAKYKARDVGIYSITVTGKKPR